MRINNKYILLGILILMGFYLLEVALVSVLSSGVPVPFTEKPATGDLSDAPAPYVSLIVNIVLEIIRLLGWLIPGFVIGLKLKNNGLLHGAIIGGIGGLISQTLTFAVFNQTKDTEFALFWLLWGSAISALLCSMSGGVGELVGRKRNN